MSRRRLVLIALVGILALVGAACAEDEEPAGGATTTPPESPTVEETTESPAPTFTTLEEGVLKVGSCLDYRPFEYREGGELVGFDVELTEAIAAELGLEVEWVKANFETIFTAVAAGDFDMVAAASTITEERLTAVDFSDPYYNARQALTANTELTPEVQSVDDLQEGDLVGVQRGTTGKAWAEENLVPRGIELKTFQTAPQAFNELEAGGIVGVINDEPSSQAEVEERPGLAVVEGIDTGEHYGLAFSKDNPALTEAVNQALAALIADGTYAAIFETYFPGVEIPPEYQA